MMKIYSLVSIRTDSCRLVIFATVNIRAVVKRSATTPDRSSSPLVHKMPVKTCEWSVLVAFVLQKQWTLLGPKLLQISEMTAIVG